MEPFSCRGIILASREFKEKDRLVSVLTADKGLVTICAKGSGRPGSKAAFASVPFMVCDFVVSVSHGYYYLKEGTIVENNSEIMSSLEAMTCASHMSSCLIDSTFQGENTREAYELAAYAFYMLAKHPQDYLIVYSAFNWRLLTIVGLTVKYEITNNGGEEICPGNSYLVSLIGGTIETARNTKAGRLTGNDHRILSYDCVDALNYFFDCPLNRLFTAKASEKVLSELKDFTTAYLSVQFDRNYDGLSVLDNIPGRR